MKQTDDAWFDLGPDRRVCFTTAKRKHGVMQPRRFLVLGPFKRGSSIRPTECAGSWVGGRAVIDHGMIGPDMLRELEAKLRERA